MKQEKQEEKPQLLRLEPIKTRLLKVDVESYPESSYISHKLQPNVVEAMTKREFGEVETKKLRDAEQEYKNCFHFTSNKKYGIPVGAFVSSVLDSCVALNIPKSKVKRAIRFLGDVVEIKYEKLNRRRDTVRRSGITKAPDLRERPEFINWSCQLLIQYDESQISPEQIINLLNSAGFMSGIGDWRPSSPKSSGTHGMYRVRTR